MWINRTYALLMSTHLKFPCICSQIWQLYSAWNSLDVKGFEASPGEFNCSHTFGWSVRTFIENLSSDRVKILLMNYGTLQGWLTLSCGTSNVSWILILWIIILELNSPYGDPHHWRSLAGPIDFWLHFAGSLISFVPTSNNPSLEDMYSRMQWLWRISWFNSYIVLTICLDISHP